MKPRLLPVLLAAALLGGCATVTPVGGELARVTMTADDTAEVRVARLALIARDGVPHLTGQARRLHEMHPLGPQHLDVVFLDAARRELALKSVRVTFTRTRTGPDPWAFFAVPVADLPSATAELVVRPHSGWTHEAPAS